ncbi:MAG: hypothetical protein LUF01_10655 [Bacteroides sp.]|nr:hypothetical protein [Bacteroides sp.]
MKMEMEDMKRKSRMNRIGWCMAVLVLAACSGKGIEEEGDGGSMKPLEITFRIGSPASDEVEYTRAAQDESETRINSLAAYDFLVTDGDTLFESVRYLTDAGDGVTTPKAGQFVRTDAGAKACLSLLTPENTMHVFAFVANEGKTHFDSVAYKKPLPIDSLRWTASTRNLKNGADCGGLVGSKGAVMTGNTVPLTLPQDLKDAGKMTAKLYRIVARIDVRNDVADASDLVIENISAGNCAPTGYLFEWSSSQSPTAAKRPEGYTALTALQRNPEVASGDLEALRQGQTCGKVMYLYEYPAGEMPVPTLRLTYRLNGVSKTVDVQMLAEDGTRIDLKRNRKYTLVVGGTATRMVCSVRSNETEK